ncbi:hypothetical protein [Helicovermis profundi]|uniref:ATP synthase F0 subunit 8 n=1 Tax=Helicovermis profundi TaxID=3065157 RepID=A0AAU9EII0_9FIRM|nr:hypothetical protein HLPR_00200 [Clostridia bacterium S502]
MGFFKIVVLIFIFFICISMFIYFIRDIFKDYLIARKRENIRRTKRFKSIKGGKILNESVSNDKDRLRLYR